MCGGIEHVSTVEPLNNRHTGTSCFVHCREAVDSSEAKCHSGALDSVLYTEVSFIKGSTVYISTRGFLHYVYIIIHTVYMLMCICGVLWPLQT